MKHYILVIFLLFITMWSHSQEITVIDQLTQERIPGVKIMCKSSDQRVIANSEGRFRLEPFQGCDTLQIIYPNYVVAEYAYSDLRQMVTVELEEVQLNVEGIEVSAYRWEYDAHEIPNRVTPIDVKNVTLENPQTTADLLASSGYVYVQKSQFGGGSPQLRGYGTNRVMLVVDGVRMNNAIFRSGNLQNVIVIDPLSLSDVEVIFGPGSVMFGSDAIGGVMEFDTKKARYAPDTTREFIQTNVFSRFNSASNEITGHADFSYGNSRFASATAVTYSMFGDLTAGAYGDSAFLRPTYQMGDQTLANPNPRQQIQSGYDQFNALHKFSFRPKEGIDWEYGFLYSTNFQDVPRYDRLIEDADEDGELDFEEWYYGPQEWMMHRIAFKSSIKHRLYDNSRMVAAYQMFKESRNDRRMGSDNIRRQFERVDAFSFNWDLEKELGEHTDFFYGLESVVNSVGSNAYREFDDNTRVPINPRYPDGALWQTHGVYANFKHHLNENWIVNAGVRMAMFGARAEFDTTLFAYPLTETNLLKVAPSGGAGIVYRPSVKTKWYFNASTGFRAPNIDDLGKVFDSEPGTVVVPNPNLTAEHVFSGETGLVKVLGSRLKLDVAIYATYLQDAMVRQPFEYNGQDSIVYEGVPSQVLAIQNESHAYTYGTQVGVEWAIVKGLTFASTFSFQRGFAFIEDSSAYFPKAQVAPTFGRVSLRYKTRQLRAEVYWVYNGEMSHKRFPITERNELIYALDDEGRVYTPAWNTLNAKASFFFNKHLSMTVGMENITNQLYRTFGSGISAAGRSFIGSVKVTF
ncbi:MAG: TonB-dependent receptor [bacterium]|nr:TonB-dependent receptor [bacterium]